MSVTLHERTDALRTVDEWILENEAEIAASGGVLPDHIEQLLNEATGQRDEKVEKVALFIRGLEGEGKFIKDEETRLAQRRKARENSAKWLKGYLLRSMQATGTAEIKRPLATVRVQLSPPSVDSTLDQPALRELAQTQPELVTIVPETVVLNARAVIDRVKAGQDAPAGVIVSQSTHVRIY